MARYLILDLRAGKDRSAPRGPQAPIRRAVGCRSSPARPQSSRIFQTIYIQFRGGTRSASWRNSAPQYADIVLQNREMLPQRPARIAVSRASPHASPYRDCRLRADQAVDI